MRNDYGGKQQSYVWEDDLRCGHWSFVRKCKYLKNSQYFGNLYDMKMIVSLLLM